MSLKKAVALAIALEIGTALLVGCGISQLNSKSQAYAALIDTLADESLSAECGSEADTLIEEADSINVDDVSFTKPQN